ncbi:ribonuclease H2 subunit B-like [Dendronephthya gigantea]|uniref:ribonuclease H2 subunit B-like n=1 Tax=Dendronephthya gigantea TaxID=151771 RepID=UPI00106D86B5|nr:ribonuclease H2 subunit B-like [Dendronephthya gigantea]
MQRSGKSKPSKIKISSLSQNSNKWVFILPEQNEDFEDYHFVMLPHPKTGHIQQYLLSKNKQEISEILKFNETPRSWFIDNSVLQDGNLYFGTKIDALFMVLPSLKSTSTKFMTLEHILQESDNNNICELSHCITKEDLCLVTDMKGEEDLIVCKLNHDKVISWLEKKVYQTEDQLKQASICTSGAQSSTFVRSSKSRGNTQDYLGYAFGLVSDYISDYWSQKLKASLGINDEISGSSEEEPACKKVKLDESLAAKPNEDYSKFFAKAKATDQNTNVKLTAAQKSLAKVNTKGMKSISSFFGVPKKSSK